MKKRVGLFSLILALLLPAFAHAFQVSIQASASKSEVAKGEGFTYKLSIIEEGEANQPVSIEPPDFTGFNVSGTFSSSSVKVIQGKARRVTEQEYRLSCDTPGEHTIPSAKLVTVDPRTGARQDIPSNPVKVAVLEKGPGILKGLEEDIRDIKSPKTFIDRVRFFFYGLMAIVVLVFFLLLGLAIYMVRRKKGALPKPPAPASAAPRSAKDAALAAIAKAESLRSDPKAFYSAIIEAMRVYLKDVYGIPALEATTTELMSQARKSALPASARDKLWSLLGEADLVKFAKHTPTEEDKTRFMEKARTLISEL